MLKQKKLLRKGMRILHFAPERSLFDLLNGYEPKEYIKADIRSSVEGMEVTYFDIPEQISDLESNTFDLVIHNHVLEHLRCSDVFVMYHIQRALVPGGAQIFSVPIWPGRHFKADFGETDPQRLNENFGQSDHVALYGSLDFEKGLGACLNIDNVYDLEQSIDVDLLDRNGIPDVFRKGLSGSSVFLKFKEDWAYSL